MLVWYRTTHCENTNNKKGCRLRVYSSREPKRNSSVITYFSQIAMQWTRCETQTMEPQTKIHYSFIAIFLLLFSNSHAMTDKAKRLSVLFTLFYVFLTFISSAENILCWLSSGAQQQHGNAIYNLPTAKNNSFEKYACVCVCLNGGCVIITTIIWYRCKTSSESLNVVFMRTTGAFIRQKWPNGIRVKDYIRFYAWPLNNKQKAKESDCADKN